MVEWDGVMPQEIPPLMAEHFFWSALDLAPTRIALAKELNADFARFMDGLEEENEQHTRTS